MGGNLRENPVIGFLCRTPGNHAVILVRRSVAVAVLAVRVSVELLLVFPEDDLGLHLIIVLVNAGDR